MSTHEGVAATSSIGRPLSVGIDARLLDGRAGGVQQYVMGLAAALSALDDGEETYSFLGNREEQLWLLPYLTGRAELLVSPDIAAAMGHRSRHRLRGEIGERIPWARALWRAAARRGRSEPIVVAASDGAIEAAGIEVMHFTFQGAFLTGVPSIYQPWDLQHIHLPEFFTPEQRAWRDAAYGQFSAQASLVVVASRWARDDVVRHLRVPPSKVAIIDVPPVLDVYPAPTPEIVAHVRRTYDLPDRFAYYPAQTWPHKNHIRLLEALAELRDHRGLDVDLVCSGVKNDQFEQIDRALGRLRLRDRVRFIGFVDPVEIQALYRLAHLMVFPSLFEGWGLPIVEAFSIGLPVACSNVTSLPDLVGDAALIFDPLDSGAIANAVARLWLDDDLRRVLSRRGLELAAQFDWSRTARTLRAHYRSIAGRPLSEADRRLIEESFGGLAA